MKEYNFGKRITDTWDYPKLSIYANDLNKKGNFFDFYNEKSSNNDGVRLYIHVPFCSSFCSFCQFYKEPYNKSDLYMDEYFMNVEKELRLYANTEFVKTQKITSVFFGGGDPSIIKYKYFKKMMDAIYRYFNVDGSVAISIEGNVRSLLDDTRLRLYKEYGVTRVSFGIQTFNESIRKKLLIKPTLQEIDKLIELINKVGVKNFAFDLMYNLPEQTSIDISRDIECGMLYNPSYIDFYSLNIYPNTKFYDDIYNKKLYRLQPDKRRELEQNKRIHREMCRAGYKQVLSCTYSKEFDLPHDGLYHYLVGGNMLGIGPSARSYLEGNSYRNVCSVDGYMKLLNQDKRPVETGIKLGEEEIRRRRVILAVTLLKIDKELTEELPDIQRKIKKLQDVGYMGETDIEYFVTEEGNPWVGNIQKVLSSDKISSKEVSNLLKAVKDGRSAYNQDFMSVLNRQS